MSATLVTPKTTSGGEIIRELVNSSDGQGLHLDGSAGGINLSTSMPDLGTKYSLEFVVKGDSKTGETYLLDAYKSGARIIFGWSGYSNGNIQLHINGTWSSAFMATPDNGQVVHLVLSVDGTSATLYQNGNSVSTQTVVANTMTSATSTHIGCSQNGTANYFNGTIYRARFYNKSLTSAEVQTAYERADVDFADQYGSQTKLIDSDFNGSFDGWNTSNDWATQTNNSNAMQLVANAANQICRTGTQLTKGKRYRVTYTASAVTGTPGFSTAAATHVVAGVISAGTANSFEFTFPTSATSQYFYIKSNASGDAVTLDDISVVQIGCVSDYDLAFANPTQSLMVQDRSGAADGTCSASGVTQVQPVVQLNSTAARIGTVASAVADGTLAIGNKQADAHSDANELVIATSAGGGGMTINTANNAGGSIYFADGTSGDDLYRGYVVYNHSSNLMALGTDALTRLTIDATGHVAIGDDNYYQWGGTNARIVGSHAGNYVKILTSNTARLVVNSAGEITQTGEGVSYTIKNSDTSLVADQLIGGVAFEKTDGSGAGAGVVGGMRMHSEGSVGESSYLAFSTADSSTNDVERVRITSDGSVGIGTPTPTVGNLQIRDASGSTLALTRTAGATTGTLGLVRFGNTSIDSNLANILVYQDNATDAAAIAFQTQPTGGSTVTRLTIGSDGLATFAQRIHGVGGISFGQTNSSATGAAATSTILDHYEEGTWTPTAGGDSTYTAQTGRYTRVGRLVTATFDLTINTRTGSSYIISGLPFSAASGENIGAGGSIIYYSSLNVSPVNFSPTVAGSTVHIRSATAAATSPSNHGLLANGSRIAGIVTYTV